MLFYFSLECFSIFPAIFPSFSLVNRVQALQLFRGHCTHASTATSLHVITATTHHPPPIAYTHAEQGDKAKEGKGQGKTNIQHTHTQTDTDTEGNSVNGLGMLFSVCVWVWVCVCVKQPCAMALALLKFLISCQGLWQTRTTCGRKVRWPREWIPAMEHPQCAWPYAQAKQTDGMPAQKRERAKERKNERESVERERSERERARFTWWGCLGARSNYVGVARQCRLCGFCLPVAGFLFFSFPSFGVAPRS